MRRVVDELLTGQTGVWRVDGTVSLMEFGLMAWYRGLLAGIDGLLAGSGGMIVGFGGWMAG